MAVVPEGTELALSFAVEDPIPDGGALFPDTYTYTTDASLPMWESDDYLPADIHLVSTEFLAEADHINLT